MSEKPVKCVCGGEPDISWNGNTWVECNGTCGRVGPAIASREEAVAAWNKDMRALQHFDELVEALEAAHNEIQDRAWDDYEESMWRSGKSDNVKDYDEWMKTWESPYLDVLKAADGDA
jgi:hypothetical protein